MARRTRIRHEFVNITNTIVTHNFGREVDVIVYDNAGAVIEVEIEVVDLNSIRLISNQSITGVVIIQ